MGDSVSYWKTNNHKKSEHKRFKAFSKILVLSFSIWEHKSKIFKKIKHLENRLEGQGEFSFRQVELEVACVCTQGRVPPRACVPHT